MRLIEGTNVRFQGEDGSELTVGYSNRGDPYREGITLSVDVDGQYDRHLFLENYEAVRLRDLLNRLYPKT